MSKSARETQIHMAAIHALLAENPLSTSEHDLLRWEALITAAPNLLQALQECADHLAAAHQAVTTGEWESPELAELAEQVDAALTAAKGREP